MSVEPPLRSPAELMRPSALARLQPTRLSFSRALVNVMNAEGWRITRSGWEIDAEGAGLARYQVATAGHTFGFVIISRVPELTGRSPRIIGGAWDMQAALIDGEAGPEQVALTRREIPKLYAGRAAPGTLVWCRSNRSMRAFDHTVDALAARRQPDLGLLAATGYLMRNTGLDANGTFGTRPFAAYPGDHPLRRPYFAQMLAAYLAREFGFDLVEHIARARDAAAPPLDPRVKSYLGLGNGSGLGLILWVNNHPHVLDAWISLRERALALVTAMDGDEFARRTPGLLGLLDRAITYFREDRMVYEAFTDSATIATDLTTARAVLTGLDPAFAPRPVARLRELLADAIGPSALEAVHALLIELGGARVDALLDDAAVPETNDCRPHADVASLLALIESEYAWALRMDLTGPGAHRYVWYKSRDAEEPRRGPHDEVPPGTVDLGLALPRDIQRLAAELRRTPPGSSVAAFLRGHPGRRALVERVQGLAGRGYHSPHANIHDEDFLPVDLIRLMNVAIYGIDKTRDYLGRNLRGLLFHGAPTRTDLGAAPAAPWFWPSLPQGGDAA